MHRPTRAENPLCWDNSTWLGCQRPSGTCNHSHELVSGLNGLHWTVVAQILRRGGLRNGPKVEPSTVDGRVAQLCTQAKAEADSKKEVGRAGQLAPAEFAEVQYTEMESELGEAVKGGDETWLKDPKAEDPYE